MTQPFDDKDVLYRFTPTAAEHSPPGQYWDVADEYAIVAEPEASCGIIVYARYGWGREWIANPSGTRALLVRLLAERAQKIEDKDVLYRFAPEDIAYPVSDAIARLVNERAALTAQEADLRQKIATSHEEICQVLGHALGYPRYYDDPVNFPDATEKDGVCVGEHVAESLAAEAAHRIQALAGERDAYRAEVERLRTRHTSGIFTTKSERPPFSVPECNCSNYRPGQLTAGWYCPEHGLRW